MANTKSAKKYMRKSAENRTRNRSAKSRLLTSEKKFHELIAKKDISAAEEQLKAVASHLDKAAKINSIHKNKADRKKARLAAELNKAKA